VADMTAALECSSGVLAGRCVCRTKKVAVQSEGRSTRTKFFVSGSEIAARSEMSRGLRAGGGDGNEMARIGRREAPRDSRGMATRERGARTDSRFLGSGCSNASPASKDEVACVGERREKRDASDPRPRQDARLFRLHPTRARGLCCLVRWEILVARRRCCSARARPHPPRQAGCRLETRRPRAVRR
jgi:hypothetical protein